MYRRVKRRNSCTVKYIENGVEHFGIIHSCLTVKVQTDINTKEYHVALVECVVVLYDKLCVAEHIKVVKSVQGSPKKLVFLDNIKEVCVWLDFDDLDVSFVSLIPNISNVA